jgi:LytS/YehU family sensor histidine kinase
MKLSKLMRYMLYENEHDRVKMSKEVEFITSYIDLMKLRFADEVDIQFLCPSELSDLEIPPMIFVSYIENAFKHGISYQQQSFVNIQLERRGKRLLFQIVNSKQSETSKPTSGGIGLINNENRLKLLFADDYRLDIHSTDKTYHVSLEIPLT